MRARWRFGVFLRALPLGLLALGVGAGEASAQLLDQKAYTFVLLDLLEYAPGSAGDPVRYDGLAWHGGDFTRLWLKAEGEQTTTGGGGGETELQALYGRMVGAFWDFQVGLRLDLRYGGEADRARGLVAVGIQGLAPYWFEVDAGLFVSHEGDVSARFAAEYDMLFSQRLIGQPRIELNAAVQEVPEFGVGAGLNDLELGWRWRYEIRREVAPYVGISWIRRIGGAAEFARLEAGKASDFSLVAGMRAWF